MHQLTKSNIIWPGHPLLTEDTRMKIHDEKTGLDLLKAIMAPFRRISPFSKISDPIVLDRESKGFNTITSMSIYTPPYLQRMCPYLLG
jgi:hypothetical protein